MRQLIGFTLRQVAVAAVTLVGIAVTVFVAMRLVPGSYADVLLGPRATPQLRAATTAQYGLDQPVTVQFTRWLGSLLRGDLGMSLSSGTPVASEIIERAWLTLELALVAGLFTLVLGVVFGVLGGLTARRRTTAPTTRLINAGLLSLPEILIGALLVYLISKYAVPFTIGVFPPFLEDPVGNLLAVIPPAAVVSTLGIGFVMATTRRSVAGVLQEPYVAAARMRGVPQRTIYARHLWRNTATPVVTVAGIYLAYLLGGVAIAEELFGLHGLGQYLIDSAARRDYPAVQGVVLVAAAAFVVINMVIDVLYGVIDPRVGRRAAT
ncbi:MAG: ABC transporter permease [Actinomycetota bacterium]|nr:ABC transporter permease [Actinomycetota bacterium]